MHVHTIMCKVDIKYLVVSQTGDWSTCTCVNACGTQFHPKLLAQATLLPACGLPNRRLTFFTTPLQMYLSNHNHCIQCNHKRFNPAKNNEATWFNHLKYYEKRCGFCLPCYSLVIVEHVFSCLRLILLETKLMLTHILQTTESENSDEILWLLVLFTLQDIPSLFMMRNYAKPQSQLVFATQIMIKCSSSWCRSLHRSQPK